MAEKQQQQSGPVTPDLEEQRSSDPSVQPRGGTRERGSSPRLSSVAAVLEKNPTQNPTTVVLVCGVNILCF